MGRQTCFFVTDEDVLDFVKFVRESGDQFIDHKGNALGDEAILDEVFQIYIKFSCSMIQKSDHGFVSVNESDVIEYSKSEVWEKRYKQGRIYAQFIKYDDKGNKYRKEKWFEKKYNYYKKWILKHYRISKNKDYYIAPGAYELYSKYGYRMVNLINRQVPEKEFSVEFEQL